MTDQQTILLLLPEFILIVTAMLVMVGGAFTRTTIQTEASSSGPMAWTIVSFVGCLGAFAALCTQPGLLNSDTLTTSGPVLLDSLGGTMRILSLELSLLCVLALHRTAAASQRTEFLGMVLLMFAGLSLTCWAGNLVVLLLALELISIPIYVLLFVARGDDAAAEATVKYFFLSILASAMFLLGLSLLFGIVGSVDLVAMQRYFAGAGVGGGPGAALVMVAGAALLAGIGYKIAIVPFHFYAPDVYQSTTNGTAGLLAVVPKIAGILVLLRILVVLLPAQLAFGWQTALVLAMVTMTVGNVCALWQKNLRRMLAYSSIAHAGYMLIGCAVSLAVATGETAGDHSLCNGFSGTLLYLIMYSIATLGTFAVLCEVGTDERGKPLDRVNQLAGLGRRRPWMAGVLAICMFSLGGIPPLAGFWGKMTLFTGAISTAQSSATLPGGRPWFLAMSLVAVLNTAIAAAYYLRIVGVAYFAKRPTSETADTAALKTGVGMAAIPAFLCGMFLVVVGAWPSALIDSFGSIGNHLVAPLAHGETIQTVPDASTGRLSVFEPTGGRQSSRRVLPIASASCDAIDDAW